MKSSSPHTRTPKSGLWRVGAGRATRAGAGVPRMATAARAIRRAGKAILWRAIRIMRGTPRDDPGHWSLFPHCSTPPHATSLLSRRSHDQHHFALFGVLIRLSAGVLWQQDLCVPASRLPALDLQFSARFGEQLHNRFTLHHIPTIVTSIAFCGATRLLHRLRRSLHRASLHVSFTHTHLVLYLALAC